MSDDIAVIGYAGRFPGAATVEDYWQLIVRGRLGRIELGPADLDAEGVPEEVRRRPNFVPVGYVLDDADAFDAELFGISPGEARLMDPQHRVLLECAWQAFEHAGRRPDALGTVGVFAGTGFSGYLIDHVRPRFSSYDTVGAYQAMLGNDKDFLATRVSYRLGLGGPSMTVQSACSSSLLAVHTACQSLLGGECDTALAGGVSVLLPQRGGYLYEAGMILSPDGYCRPFDAEAAGTVPGRGAGVVLLKPLDAAIADGDTVHGVIMGSAVNNDGSAKLAYTAPNGDRQREVIATAQAIAGVRAADIGYVEAHGTGTQLGDPVEVAALSSVFRAGGAESGGCALGSVKANIGHLDAAAGVAGLIKVLLMLRGATIPPQVNFRTPNPALNLEQSPFRVPTTGQPWTPGPAGRLAAVTSTGIGGTNVHVVLAEAPAPQPVPAAREREVLVLSARSPEELDRLAGRLADAVSGQPELGLSDVAHTLQDGRRVFDHRRAVAAGSVDEAARLLREPASSPRTGGASVVFAFPGQGSQYPGMGAWLHGVEPVFRDAVAECAEEFAPRLGLDLRTVLYGSDAERLTDTMLAQAALFTTGYALARLWESWGVRPAAMIGHSIGEYVAATISGVFTPSDAVRAVAARGRLMREMPAGLMAAVALPEAQIRPMLGAGVEIAAINAADAVVVSGERSSVSALLDVLRADGVRCRELATSHAFHSASMAPAAARLAEELREIPLRPPTSSFVANPDGVPITAEQAVDPDYWARQLREPVRFHDGIGALLRSTVADSVPVVLELGPPSGLAAAARRHPDRVPGQMVAGMLPRADATVRESETVNAALASVWAAGVDVDWAAVRGNERRRRVVLPGQALRRTSHWLPAVRTGAAPDEDENGKLADIADWFSAPGWRTRPARASDSAQRKGSWLLIAPDGAGLADGLAERLSGLGHHVRRVRPGADYPALLAAGEGPPHVVYLTGPAGDPDEIPEAFADLLALARALAARPAGGRVRLRVVAEGVWRVRPSERHTPGLAPIAGLLSVLPQEIGGLDAGVVDIGASVGPNDLVEELLGTEDDAMVCLRAGEAFVPRLRPLRLRDAAGDGAGVRERGVYLITGGTGRLGLAIAEHLAETVSARLVLVGRGVADPERVRAIGRAGGEVLSIAADVAVEAELRRTVDAARDRFGALHGVVHAAGLAGPAAVCLVPNLTEQACAEHFRAKVTGTRVLATVLRDVPLDFCLLMSSTATLLGGPGLAAYAAANSYLNAFAERTPGWTSVLWDAWRTGEAASPRHVLAMTAAEGVEALGRLLDAGALGQVVVSTTPIQPRLARWRANAMADDEPKKSTVDTPALPTTHDELQQVVATVWRDALGVGTVGLDDNFFDLGGDSLIGLRVIGELEARLGSRVPATALYEGTTVRRLAELLRGDQQPASFDEQTRRARERRQALAATTRRRAEKGR